MGTRRIAEECRRVDVRSLRESGELEAGDVAVTIPNGREVQTVGVEWTPCTFGGERPWLLCPGCGRRVGVLYDAGEGIFCRICGNLAYREENATRPGRVILRAKKLHVRLGGTGNLLEELPPKARARALTELSESAYDRLRARGEATMRAAFEVIEAALREVRAGEAQLERIRERARGMRRNGAHSGPLPTLVNRGAAEVSHP